MTCRQFADFMMDYLNGELTADVVEAFERHLARCANCHSYLAQYMATVTAGREAFADDDASVPPDVPEELIRAILANRK